MINQPHPPPKNNTVNVDSVVNLRLALEQIKEPTEKIATAKAKLDDVILYNTNGINPRDPNK